MKVHDFPGAELLRWLEPLLPLEEWLPTPYQRYAPLLRDGLAFFLASLPAPRLQAIGVEQTAMATAKPMTRVAALMRHCPVLHKLAQVLAHDRRLAAELRLPLSALESLPAGCSAADAARWLAAEVSAFEGLEVDAPLAEASVALVIPFRKKAQSGVFKLLKPGIEQRMDEDLARWSALASFLERRAERYALEALQYRATLDSVALLLRAELRLDREQAHLAQAAEIYAHSRRIKIPQLLSPYCGARLTAMERIEGSRFDDLVPGSTRARAVAGQFLEGLFVEPLLYRSHSTLIHGDPHPGNLLLLDDGRIALLDWALAAHLDTTVRRQMARLLLAACLLDAGGVADAVAALGHASSDPAALARVARQAVRRLRWGERPGADWLLGLLDSAAVEARTYFPKPLIVLRKALQMAFGLYGDLAPDDNPGRTLTVSAAWQIMARLGLGELPPSGLDTADWPELALRASWLPGRLWFDWMMDWAETGKAAG